MTDTDLRTLHDEMRAGFEEMRDSFKQVNDRLDVIEHDMKAALGGFMSAVLAPEEVSSIQSKMHKPFPVEIFPSRSRSSLRATV